MNDARWPADNVERRKVGDLIPYARNSRTHSDEQVAQIAASIREWGWTVPVLIDPDGGIIAGHGRIMAAQKLGIKNVPCMVADSLAATGFDIRAQIVWAKERLVLSRGHYHWRHEPCWYAVRGNSHWTGDRKQSTLWSIPNRDQDAETVHGTQKPVECMRRPILNNSSPGQAVYEPFSGSGTTIIAAETTGRACFAMELDPAYVDVAVRRWEAFTGESATLEGDGQTFSRMSEARHG